MGEQTNGFDQNGRGTLDAPGAVEPDIPVLKKKEKEKKGAGVVLPAAVAPAAVLTAGQGLGKLGIAALALGVGGVGMIGLGMVRQKAPTGPDTPQLEALSSNIAVGRRNATGSKSLSYMAEAGSGQLKWEDPNKAAAKGPEKTSDAPADVAEPAAASDDTEEAMPDPGLDKPEMAHNLSGARLSSGLGGAGSFGKNNIFAKGTGFNVKGLSPKPKSDLAASRLSAQRSNLSAARRGRNNLSAKSLSTNKILTGKTIGQLKFAGARSATAKSAGDTGAASTYAADAFDQTKTGAGTLETGGSLGEGLGGTISPPGTGAPDTTTEACPSGYSGGEGGGCVPPDIANGVNQTRYQGLVDGARQMQTQSKTMFLISVILMALGAVLMFFLPPVGAILLALGLMLMMMARQMGNQAKQMGQMIDSAYGQQEQGQIIQRAGDDAQGGENSGNNDERAESIEQKLNKDRVDEHTNDAGFTVTP
ncbi:MAG: hypothetical protein HYZ75_00340 [Elusimicrobia bacterium]|nr:hypothetical protein [Elusimicrobiota bacterium]